MNDLIDRARAFAILRHQGQERKYTCEPYWHHLAAVAGIVEEYGGTPEMIAAAWLHDTVEDTSATKEDIRDLFGMTVGVYVYFLTDASRSEDGNRIARKKIDREHIAACQLGEVHTIKLADLIDNTSSIVEHDKNFARVYLAEKDLLLEVLTRGHPKLRERAYEVLRAAQQVLVQDALGKMD